jgi:hypothetical protein
MTPVTLHPPKLKGTPALVFHWRGTHTPLLPKLIALAFSCVMFGLLITTVRIRVVAPQKSTPHKASVIYLGDDLESRALTLRASEGGPFPSRFEFSQWEGLAELETIAMNAIRYQRPPYVPALQDLPAANQLQASQLAANGELFFPKRNPVPSPSPDLAKLKLAPALYPVSGISKSQIPRELPSFTPAVDAAMSSASWRFLVRLNAEGIVAECVSLEKGGEPGAPELEAWLHRVHFMPDPAKPVRWIALGIEFTNQAADGTDAR